MRGKLLCIITLLISLSAYANVADVTITQPTKSSNPLPSLNTTKNIDTVLSEKVQAKIRATPILKNEAVTAASIEQVITLEGSVDTKEQEKAAIAAAKSIKGVKDVKSQLTIKLLPTKALEK
jgi:osmotically-inducible protein OsmY